MTRKKKLTKQQRKEQRRAAMERVRRERGWQPPPPPPRARQNELLDDMLPLFPEIGDPFAPLPPLTPVIETLVASSDLADEPEFEDIIVDPMLCTATFIKAAEEMGYDPDSLLEVSEEEREDAHLGILEETVRRLLTDDLRQQIRADLDRLRLRLKEAGEQEEAAKAAMLLSFLDEDSSDEMWAMVGLVQAIFHRSVFIGFEMAESAIEAVEAQDSDEDPGTLLNRLAQSRLGQKAESLLKRVPGLHKYLAKQADTTWDEGLQAIFEGDLYLELYSEEELYAGLGLFRQALGDAIEEARSEGRPAADVPEDKAQDFVLQVDRYITDLFTLERLDQARARLDAVLRARALENKWFPFLMMLKQYMDDPDAAENERHFFATAFLGELKHVGRMITGGDE
jgi:hypothetical protein